MNTYTFYKKWLRDLEADQTPEGGVPHVVPNIEEGRTFCSSMGRCGNHQPVDHVSDVWRQGYSEKTV